MDGTNDKDRDKDLSMTDLEGSLVLISETEKDSSNLDQSSSITMSASKRKRDEMLELDSENGDSDSFIKMENLSPEPRRKYPTGTTPLKSDEGAAAKILEAPIVLDINNIDDNLPEHVILLNGPDGSKVYVVGTAHFSKKSMEDVSTVIKAVKPHRVVVELCSSRTDFLYSDEEAILQAAKDLSFSKVAHIMKTNGPVKGLVHVALLSMTAQITKQLGIAPGGEFRQAFTEAEKIPNCLVLLGDRPIGVTMSRLLSGLSVWQSVKIIWNILSDNELINLEAVEKTKQKDFMEAMLADLSQDFPIVKEVLVSERDKYLAYSLHNAASGGIPEQSARVVGVVGLGHQEGIKRHWLKVSDAEMRRISEVPPPSLSIRVVKLTVKCALLAGTAYAAYKIVPPAYKGISSFVQWVVPPLPALRISKFLH